MKTATNDSSGRRQPAGGVRQVPSAWAGPSWHVIVLGLLYCLFFASFSSAAVPASQPTSIYDDQPIHRSHAATNPASTPETFNVQRLIVAMAVVLTLIFVLRYAAGWFFPATKATRGSRAVRILARTPIAPRQQVMLLHVGRRVIVVGDSGGALSSLGQIQDPDEVAELIGQSENAELPSIGGRFGALFGRAKDEMESADLSVAEPMDDAPNVSSTEIDDARGEISNLISRMRALTQAVRKE